MAKKERVDIVAGPLRDHCGDCFFSVHIDNSDQVQCHFNAPEPLSNTMTTGDYQVVWPKVDKTDWCGDYDTDNGDIRTTGRTGGDAFHIIPPKTLDDQQSVVVLREMTRRYVTIVQRELESDAEYIREGLLDDEELRILHDKRIPDLFGKILHWFDAYSTELERVFLNGK